jgi:hypothetical protein
MDIGIVREIINRDDSAHRACVRIAAIVLLDPAGLALRDGSA